ncbi:MAG: pilus assembly protein TadG-related protein [Actinomycetota bacterium]
MSTSPTSVIPGDPVARRDRGQAAILLVVAVTTVLIVFLVALAGLGATSIDRTRAQTAADAAALASLDGGREVAERFASAHGAELVEWTDGPGADEVTVVVRLGEVTAIARASDSFEP